MALFLNLCLDLPVCLCVCVCVCVCAHVCTCVYATVSLKLKPTFYFEPFKQHLNTAIKFLKNSGLCSRQMVLFEREVLYNGYGWRHKFFLIYIKTFCTIISMVSQLLKKSNIQQEPNSRSFEIEQNKLNMQSSFLVSQYYDVD